MRYGYSGLGPDHRGWSVVVLTSSKEDEDMVRSHLLGVNSYLQKPVSFEQFRGMVKELGLYWLLRISNRLRQVRKKGVCRLRIGRSGHFVRSRPRGAASRTLGIETYEVAPLVWLAQAAGMLSSSAGGVWAMRVGYENPKTFVFRWTVAYVLTCLSFFVHGNRLHTRRHSTVPSDQQN